MIAMIVIFSEPYRRDDCDQRHSGTNKFTCSRMNHKFFCSTKGLYASRPARYGRLEHR
jgi:hypothetical protein